MSIGAVGYMRVGIDSAQAIDASSTPMIEAIPFLTENIEIQKNDIIGEEIANAWDEISYFQGFQNIQGNVSLRAHPISMGYFLRTAFDAYSAHQGGTTLGQAQFITSHQAIREHHFVAAALATNPNAQFQTGSGTDLPSITLEIHRGPANVGSA